MNKVKTIKVKNEDGSISEESYAIAADALNIDMANGKNVQETIGTIDVDKDGDIAAQLNKKINKSDIIDNLDSTDANKVLSAKQGKVLNEAVAAANSDIKKKIYYFNTIVDMKAANLQVGDTCQTLGYYEANDGGASLYKIVDDNTLVDAIDNSFIIQINDKLVAELIIDSEINAIQLGCDKTGTNDNTDIINNAINKLTKNGKTIYFPDGQYNITQIVMKSNVSLKGESKQTILYNTSDIQDTILIKGVGSDYVSNFTIENFTITSREQTSYENDTRAGINIYLSRSFNLKELDILHFKYGIKGYEY